MMFSSKIAKLGKAKNIKIYEKTSGNFVAILTNDTTSIKKLTISGTDYSLKPVSQRFIYSQMEHLSDNKYLAGIGDNYSIIEVEDGI